MLSRRLDYIENTLTKLQRILKVNKDRSLSVDMHEFNTIIRILYDNNKQFPIKHRKA